MDGFEPLASYDRPRLIAEMILDNEVTLRGIQRGLFGPDRLTAAERDGAVGRLKAAAGGTGLGDALIDIVTNPFVWLGLAFSPAHQGRLDDALKRGVPLFAPKAATGALQREHALGMVTSQLLTPNQAFPEGLMAALSEKKQLVEEIKIADGLRSGPVLNAWKARNGMSEKDILDSTRFGAKTPQKISARTLELIGAAYASGLGEDQLPMVKELRKAYFKEIPATSGTTRVLTRLEGPNAQSEYVRLQEDLVEARKVEPEGQDPYVLHEVPWEVVERPAENVIRAWAPKEVLEGLLKQHGSEQLIAHYQEIASQKYRDLLGLEGGSDASLVVDPVKVENQSRRAWKEELDAGRRVSDNLKIRSLQGQDIPIYLSSLETRKAVAAGIISKDHLASLWKEMATVPLDTNHLPLNVTEKVLPSGGRFPVVPEASSIDNLSGRLIPRTTAKSVYHIKDIEEFAEMLGMGPEDKGGWSVGLREAARDFREKAKRSDGSPIVVHRLNLPQAVDRYMNDMRLMKAYRGTPISDHAEQMLARDIRQSSAASELKHPPNVGQSEVQFANTLVGSTPGSSPRALYSIPLSEVPQGELPGLGSDWKKAFTLADVVEMGDNLLSDPISKKLWRNTVVPGMFGKMSVGHIMSSGAFYEMQRSMSWLANGPIGKFLETNGHSDFVGKWRSIAKSDKPMFPGGGLSYGLAKGLYVTHLGFNLGSVILNMFQPLVLGGTMLGPTAVLRAYGSAMGEMLDYAKARVGKYGLGPISDAERLDLMKKHFSMMGSETQGVDVLRIGPNPLSAIDTSLMTQAGHGPISKTDQFFHYAMLGFEKSEWLNRNVMAHAFKIRAADAGRAWDSYAIGQAARVVQESQFPSGTADQPMLFLTNRFMSNPLTRQFFTYNLRAFTAGFHVLPRMLEQNFLPGMISSMARGMGISAVMYELGKNLVGGDISHGLYADSITSIAGGDRFFDKDRSPIPLPPAADIPINMVRALAGGDTQLLGQSVSRLIPGGVALSRALGVLPKTPATAIGLQRTYVDWGARTPEGLVPVFKSDGSLMDYRSGTDLILHSMGADLGRWQNPGELDNYLVQIRDETQSYRQAYLQALKGNNIPKAKGIAAEYEKRNKLPLGITAQQVKQSIALSEVPRTERALNRLPGDQREIYSRMVQQVRGEKTLGLPEGSLTQLSTASQRSGLRNRTIRMDAQTEAFIREQTAERSQQPPFAPF